MVLICSGNFNIDLKNLNRWREREDLEIRTWSEIHETTLKYYKHYRAILEGDITHPDFFNKQKEVAQTREVIQKGTIHRDAKMRKQGLGPQDKNDEFKDN